MSQFDKLITDPLSKNNPVTVQVLGVCSALAVTSSIEKALVMAVAVTFVTAFSNFIISLIRNYIPGRIRMIVQLVVIAFLVTLVSISLKVFMYDLYKELSLFVGLIITNCIVMGRLEAFAMANKPLPSLLDGVGNGLGYGVILVIVGALRELFGKGQLLGFNVLGDSTLKTGLYSFGYTNNGLMVLPIASIFIIGVMVWIHRYMDTDLVDIS